MLLMECNQLLSKLFYLNVILLNFLYRIFLFNHSYDHLGEILKAIHSQQGIFTAYLLFNCLYLTHPEKKLIIPFLIFHTFPQSLVFLLKLF